MSQARQGWAAVVGEGSPITVAEVRSLDAAEGASGSVEDPAILASGLRKAIGSGDPAMALRGLAVLSDRPKEALVAAVLGGAGGVAFLLKWMNEEGPVAVAAAKATGAIFGASNPSDADEMLAGQRRTYLAEVCARLCKEDIDEAECQGFLVGLTNSLRADVVRIELAKVTISQQTRGISVIAALVDPGRHHQVQVVYQALMTLWLISFVKDLDGVDLISAEMDQASVPRRLISLLRGVSADKVVRLSLATLRSLATKNFNRRLRREMVGAGLVSVLEELAKRRWPDSDIEDDLAALTEASKTELQQMSTFDVYRHEVLSGALEWSPVHKDPQFWRQNLENLEANQLEVPKCMARLLVESSQPTVLAIACHDLAEFIKNHPRGKTLAQQLKIKPRLMELMSDSDQDPEVRRYALTCAQIIMISHWDMIQRQN